MFSQARQWILGEAPDHRFEFLEPYGLKKALELPLGCPLGRRLRTYARPAGTGTKSQDHSLSLNPCRVVPKWYQACYQLIVVDRGPGKVHRARVHVRFHGRSKLRLRVTANRSRMCALEVRD